MPSVTDMMEPTLRASVTPLKFSIRCLMRSLISVALIAIPSVPLKNLSQPGPMELNVLAHGEHLAGDGKVQFHGWLGSEFVGNAVETGTQRAVDDEIAGAQNSAADQLRVGLAVQPHLTLEPPL